MASLVISTDAPVVAGPPQGHWTYTDWEALPDDGNRYEVIDGVLYMTTAPSDYSAALMHAELLPARRARTLRVRAHI